jgi:hypothetical protein
MNARQHPPQRITHPDHRTALDDGTVYTPFFAEGVAGLRCTRPGSPTQYIYFNPSDHTDGDVPNVFVYQGIDGHPFSDTPIHHYVIWPDADRSAQNTTPSHHRLRAALTRLRRATSRP